MCHTFSQYQILQWRTTNSLLLVLQVAKEVEAIADKLSKECNKGTYKVKRTAAPRPLSSAEPSSPQNTNSPSMWVLSHFSAAGTCPPQEHLPKAEVLSRVSVRQYCLTDILRKWHADWQTNNFYIYLKASLSLTCHLPDTVFIWNTLCYDNMTPNNRSMLLLKDSFICQSALYLKLWIIVNLLVIKCY